MPELEPDRQTGTEPNRPVRAGPVQPGPTFQTGRSSPVFTGLFLIFDNSLKDQKLLNFAHFYGFNDFNGQGFKHRSRQLRNFQPLSKSKL